MLSKFLRASVPLWHPHITMIPLFHWNTPELHSYLKRIDSRGSAPDEATETQVSEIVTAVRTRGDAAVREFTHRFEGIDLKSLRIDPEEIRKLAAQADPELRQVLRLARENIRQVSRAPVGKILGDGRRPMGSASGSGFFRSSRSGSMFQVAPPPILQPFS